MDFYFFAALSLLLTVLPTRKILHGYKTRRSHISIMDLGETLPSSFASSHKVLNPTDVSAQPSQPRIHSCHPIVRHYYTSHPSPGILAKTKVVTLFHVQSVDFPNSALPVPRSLGNLIFHCKAGIALSLYSRSPSYKLA